MTWLISSYKSNSLNEGRLTNEQTGQLLPLLKSGRWLTISYISQTGKQVKLKLSLRGATASLLFIDEHYTLHKKG
ncbi:hypothetical protein [Spartinivicinus poritis]|uniref:Uncharacterized protein n=1 Tax=Spartinivicinus poritis TaxID=2994640 RepID=A0ABT5UJH6_9GAMM|nr:hypothetical protein [Spartinivicinus sp. A2-2]MDE1465194.1 hypothetical protein [Spartinivicinus sp. A2-2]